FPTMLLMVDSRSHWWSQDTLYCRHDVGKGKQGQPLKFHQFRVAGKPNWFAPRVFGRRGTEWPSADIIEDVRIGIGLLDELGGSRGQPDNRIGSKQLAYCCNWDIFLANVHAVNGNTAAH